VIQALIFYLLGLFLGVYIKRTTSIGQLEELYLLVSTIFEFNFSGNADTKTLLLNGRSKATINGALVSETQCISNILSGYIIICAQTLEVSKNLLSVCIHSHSVQSPFNP
jgi:hypothetical protein